MLTITQINNLNSNNVQLTKKNKNRNRILLNTQSIIRPETSHIPAVAFRGQYLTIGSKKFLESASKKSVSLITENIGKNALKLAEQGSTREVLKGIIQKQALRKGDRTFKEKDINDIIDNVTPKNVQFLNDILTVGNNALLASGVISLLNYASNVDVKHE